MLKDTVREYKDIRRLLRPLVRGLVVAVDPSIGSTSSMPGWAAYRAGELVGSGVLEIDASAETHRLRYVALALAKVYRCYPPDVLVYEDIAPRRYGGGSAHGHASLLKSVGAILSVPGPDHHLGLRPTQWKRQVRESYVKGDEADAIEMGYVAVSTAQWVIENDPPRGYRA